MVRRPAIVQASSSQPGALIRRVDSAEVMKIPEPIIEPITIMVASSGPRPRTSFVVRTCPFVRSAGAATATPAALS